MTVTRALSVAAALVAAPALAFGGDTVTVEPSDEAGVVFVVVYENAGDSTSTGTKGTLESERGPIAYDIEIAVDAQNRERFILLDWPPDLLPDEIQMDVRDGETARILFREGMM